MKIQINPSTSLRMTEESGEVIFEAIADTFRRFGSITKIEAFLTDENGAQNGFLDKTCLLEARVTGSDPVIVSATSPKLYNAVDMAIDKLESTLERDQGRMSVGV